MLRKLANQVSCADFLLKGFCLAFFVMMSCHLIAMAGGNDGNENDALKIRIRQFYDYFKARNFDKLLTIFSDVEIETKKRNEFEEYFRQYYNSLTIKDYSVEAIEIVGMEAKVKMNIKAAEGNEVFPTVTFDYWSYSKGNWYLTSFGRTK
jgi:hypothetical protein